MKSFRGSSTSVVDSFVTLSQNSSAANGTLGAMLVNEQHRYLLLKYFDNERSVTMTTIGGGTLATVAVQASGATTATLTSSWSYVSAPQLVVFANGQQRTVNFTQNSATITWANGLTSATTTATITTQGVQSYPLPANVSKVKNETITIGQLVYSPAPVQSIQEWTKLNALPYTSDIPAYFFIYNNQLNLWPIPSSTGNIMTLNCQVTIGDMNYSDYSTGTISSMPVGSNIITGSSTSWSTQFPANVDLTFANLFLVVPPPKGDGIPYQIQMFTSDTQATLTKPVVNAPNISSASYVIGQYPLLFPDFHDVLVYGALKIYYSSIAKDPEKFGLYDGIYKEKLQQMQFYLSTKQVNVDLSVTPVQQNSNLYLYPTSTQ